MSPLHSPVRAGGTRAGFVRHDPEERDPPAANPLSPARKRGILTPSRREQRAAGQDDQWLFVPMPTVFNVFKGKRTIERPPIGRLVHRRGLWETKTPSPPIDSRGILAFRAGADGPSAEQLNAFSALAASYVTLQSSIIPALFREYEVLRKDGWELLPAATADAMVAVTRLGAAVIERDSSACLSFDLYFYHEPSQAIQVLDHQLNVIVRDGRVVDVLFEG